MTNEEINELKEKARKKEKQKWLAIGIVSVCVVFIFAIAITLISFEPSNYKSSSTYTTSTYTTRPYTTSSYTTSLYSSSSVGYYYPELDADEWYVSKTYSPLKVKNCAIQRADPFTGTETVSVLYYPVCTSCHYGGTRMEMAAVSPNNPKIQSYYCLNCKTSSVVMLRIYY